MRWRNTVKLAKGADNPSVDLVRHLDYLSRLCRDKVVKNLPPSRRQWDDRLVSLNLRKWWSEPIYPSGFSIREQLKTLYNVRWLGQAQINWSVWIVLNKHRKVRDSTPQLRAQRSVSMGVRNIWEPRSKVFFYYILLILLESVNNAYKW
jgi:hypothetical protein